MVSAQELRAKIASYVSGEVSLDDLDEWFSANTWNMHQDDSDAEAQELAAKVELLLAEHSSGHLLDGELRSDLQREIQPSNDEVILELVISLGISASLIRTSDRSALAIAALDTAAIREARRCSRLGRADHREE
jgi:hypothetical protein